MAIARTNDFPDKDLKVADFARALSHPARVAILMVLAEKRECICGELVADLPLAQSTVSQHLKALKEAGLIRGEIDGPRSSYCIDWKAFEKLDKIFEGFRDYLLDRKVESKC
jgi:DNA-binding transcriptional ArsR family regulator